ncbi:px domain containing protein [Stylonychia lemnae]|uniref:Px domain containing protein n=1 Tax=Stylonychia lemnae TaxID=5949 RepID=A0A078AZ19_STYLE|nr:px domain containing protein [Stylonychia lemnae]|eukprot:CDW87379.1 px domain containing protein [Stylonychia lemnae]
MDNYGEYNQNYQYRTHTNQPPPMVFDQNNGHQDYNHQDSTVMNNVNGTKFNQTQSDQDDYAESFGQHLTNQSQQQPLANPYHNNNSYQLSQAQANTVPKSIFEGHNEFYDLKSGIASNFKDIMNLRKQEPPVIEVAIPVIKNGHHEYQIIGNDQLGHFDVSRRFKHFHLFREILYKRFLGLYIPPIPEKKKLERQIFLDRFMKEVALLPYIYESLEFQTFIRPSEDVVRALEKLPKMTTDDLLKRFREIMPVNEMADPIKLKHYNDKINDFNKDCGEFIAHLRQFKIQIKRIVPIKEQEVMHYKGFIDMLVKYEDLNIKKANEETPFQVNILSGDNCIDMKDKLTQTCWVQGELMELSALLQCISRKEGVEAMRTRAISKLRDDKDTADKLGSGKFTFKGLFKSQTGKATETQNILQTIAQTEQDIQNYQVIKDYLLIYLHDIAIPAFKHQKMQNYVKAMILFCDSEINNSNMQVATWQDFKEAIKKVKFE